MDKALRVYSLKGLLSDEVEAGVIKSRQDARRLGPFCARDRSGIVTWVRPTWEGNRRTRISHFRQLPETSQELDLKGQVVQDFAEIQRQKSRSQVHNQARDALAIELRKKIGFKLAWAIPGGELSDFPLVGDLMEGVEEVETEYEVKTPFGRSYRFDIALLGPKLPNSRILLGAIELEDTHEFESAKCLLCKCLGFPLISLDLENLPADEVSGEALLRQVIETTATSEDRRRRNYFYLHTSLYPAYLKLPSTLRIDERHQFVIFASRNRTDKILQYLTKLRGFLGLETEVDLHRCRWSDDAPVRAQFENEGSIAGHDWRSYSEREYLRVTMGRPSALKPRNRIFHLAMAKVLNSDCPALVGYKLERGDYNSFRGDPFWEKEHFPEGELARRCRVAPKHLSEPIDSILRAVESIGQRRLRT